MACALKVHGILKDGFLEPAYGDALEIEFNLNSAVEFRQRTDISTRRDRGTEDCVDMMVNLLSVSLCLCV